MGAMQRSKGNRAEREIAGILADLTGWDIRRRVRQHGRDDDLTGAPGWSVEVKRHATYTRGDLRAWWDQASAQARLSDARPVLFVRRDRDEWRAIWLPGEIEAGDYLYTVEGSPHAWASAAREIEADRTAAAQRIGQALAEG